jgi:perosamine synthetase
MSRPDIREEDIQAVMGVLRSGTLSLGPWLQRFEAAFAAYVGAAHAIAVSSGTAGLHMAVRALGIGEGDEVLTSPFSFVASANCLLYERARPVFVDVDEQTMTIDPALAEAAANDRTRAILPVHVFGQPCDMDPLVALCRSRDLVMIEDACEAIGAEYRGRQVGAFGQAAVYSFYPNKQMTTGEGAVVTTDDPALATLLRSLRNQGRNEGGAWLSHERLGFNYRMSELSAALGAVQIGRIDEMLEMRRRVADLYRAALAGVPGVAFLAEAPWTTRLSWFAAIVRLDGRVDRDALIQRLADEGIPARAYFAPLHLQPFYRELGYRPGDFPVTERLAGSALALPFHNGMSEGDVEIVRDALARCL